MQNRKVKEIKERWEKRKAKNPDLKCNHTRADLEKEYYFGSATGDYVCPKCGEAFWEGQIPQDTEDK